MLKIYTHCHVADDKKWKMDTTSNEKEGNKNNGWGQGGSKLSVKSEPLVTQRWVVKTMTRSRKSFFSLLFFEFARNYSNSLSNFRIDLLWDVLYSHMELKVPCLSVFWFGQFFCDFDSLENHFIPIKIDRYAASNFMVKNTTIGIT